MITLEIAKGKDADVCTRIIDEGRAFQRRQGFTQWTQGYPDRAVILRDIEDGKGYVLKVDGEIAGYLCLDFTGEPAYDHIDGAWSADAPYAVVHRMAFSAAYQGRGLADAAFARIEDVCRDRGVPYLRVDTGVPNRRMQHIFEKNGFRKCGFVEFYGRMVAYDKLL